jgi:hypothetical protein
LLIVLEGKIVPEKEIDIITEINLKYEVLISVYPISKKSHFTVQKII